jgi:hypothetical protein
MDGQRLDDVARALAGGSRRQVVKGLAGAAAAGLLALVGGRRARADRSCKPSGDLPQSKCNKDEQCCSRVCYQGRCCSAATSCPAGQDCGTAPDGCGGSLGCGSCTPPNTCGGGGTPDACGCTPTSCAAEGKNCGTLDDGCGVTLTCGSCAHPLQCVEGQCRCCQAGEASRCGDGLHTTAMACCEWPNYAVLCCTGVECFDTCFVKCVQLPSIDPLGCDTDALTREEVCEAPGYRPTGCAPPFPEFCHL